MTKFRQAVSELDKIIDRHPSFNYCKFTDLPYIVLRSDYDNGSSF